LCASVSCSSSAAQSNDGAPGCARKRNRTRACVMVCLRGFAQVRASFFFCCSGAAAAARRGVCAQTRACVCWRECQRIAVCFADEL
jgi:hypothetical protein